MTIHLPEELERSIHAAVQSGRFASVDDAMIEAVRLLLETLKRDRVQPQAVPSGDGGTPGLGSIGAMRDAADELDEAVEHALKLRQRPWRQPDVE